MTENTYLTRNNAGDDWLKPAPLRRRADLYRQQDVNVTSITITGVERHPRGGISGFQCTRHHAAWTCPLHDGRAFLRTDTVAAGCRSLLDRRQRPLLQTFGTAPRKGAAAMTPENHRHQRGGRLEKRSLGRRYRHDADGLWGGRLDRRPWPTGGDWNHIGWTLAASRQPISSSLLAFGGAKDPNTGTTWGGAPTGVSRAPATIAA